MLYRDFGIWGVCTRIAFFGFMIFNFEQSHLYVVTQTSMLF